MVEKMSLVTVVGEISKSEKVLKTLIETGQVNPVDADIGLKVIRDNYKESWGIPTCFLGASLSKMSPQEPLESAEDKLCHLFNQLKIKRYIDKTAIDLEFSREQLECEVDDIYKEFLTLDEKIKTLDKEKEKLMTFACMQKLESVDFDLATLKSLDHFDIRLGKMDYEYEKRIELNYDNINALVLKVGVVENQTIYMFIFPVASKVQVDNLLRSMHFEPLEILWDYMDYPSNMIKRLQRDINEINSELERLQEELSYYRTKFEPRLVKAYTHLRLEETYNDMRQFVYCDNQSFITAFWIPVDDVEHIEKTVKDSAQNIHFIEHDDDIVKGATVPTKLFNSRLFRPFETLVNLYGTPNYREVDPTGFLAIAYMFLFGAMFGDLGQGFIFWIAGFIMGKRTVKTSISGVLKRIGASSMVFGIIYDSIFGVEHAISGFLVHGLGFEHLEPMFLRPIENTNIMLLLSILVGIILLLISFGFSIYNKLSKGDIKEGVFGRNGINGLALFIGLLSIGAMLYFKFPSWSIRLGVFAVGISILLLIIREPLSNVLAKKLPLYHEGAGAYYMESGFELLETLLGMLSNGISFIRVGAFALNHVGLFIAFHTIAKMIGTHAGNISMYIIGNIVVIALEGLIVFIQGLRLVYYELFSKFYEGDGQPFVGINISANYDEMTK